MPLLMAGCRSKWAARRSRDCSMWARMRRSASCASPAVTASRIAWCSSATSRGGTQTLRLHLADAELDLAHEEPVHAGEPGTRLAGDEGPVEGDVGARVGLVGAGTLEQFAVRLEGVGRDRACRGRG